MRKSILPLLILLFSILYIFVIPNINTFVNTIFKLIPMALIILYAYRSIPFLNRKLHSLILIGLLFSMIGDGTLIWFTIGLSAFLIGHLFYIAGFFQAASFTLSRFSFIVILLPFSGWMSYHLITSLQANGESALIIPVIIYVLTIMTMGLVAMLTNNIYAIVGSILFIISDSILAWNKFISPIGYSAILIMCTYYTAQFLIATSLKTIDK